MRSIRLPLAAARQFQLFIGKAFRKSRGKPAKRPQGLARKWLKKWGVSVSDILRRGESRGLSGSQQKRLRLTAKGDGLVYTRRCSGT
jgi:hypothetical protein